MNRTSTVVAVASGKGGVGKSVIAANLADVLAIEGRRVALLDADLAQGACSILLNEQPSLSLADVSRGNGAFEDAFHDTITGVTLIEAAREIVDIPARHERIYEVLDLTVETLADTHDIVLIDCAAGSGDQVRWAFDRADTGLIVLVEEPTAIADAYRLVKYLWSTAPELPLLSVVNFADGEADAESVSDRFGAITERFTGLRPCPIGWVPFSRQVRTSVHNQSPVVRREGVLRDRFSAIASAIAGRPSSKTHAGSAFRAASAPV
jgi:flagellar biosynthesis protein FlhG